MSENQRPADTRSASQKIADLENAMISLYQTCDNMARDLTMLKEALELLGNKVSSMCQAQQSGEAFSDEIISRIMVQNNVNKLADAVTRMIAQGFIAPSEAVTDNSFIAGQELNDAGEVVQQRRQLAIQVLPEELKAKFRGAKAGDLLNLREGSLKFKVTEVYEIQQPKQAEAPAPAESPAPEAAPEASPAPAADAPPAAEAPIAQPDQTVTPAT
jgi:hypothetical protein